MPTLEETLLGLCADCEHVGCAWVSPDGNAFVLEAARTVRWSEAKGWRRATLVWPEAHELTAVNEVFAKVVKKHPDVVRELSTVVSYCFRPGAGWRDIYRKSTEHKRKKGQGDE